MTCKCDAFIQPGQARRESAFCTPPRRNECLGVDSEPALESHGAAKTGSPEELTRDQTLSVMVIAP